MADFPSHPSLKLYFYPRSRAFPVLRDEARDRLVPESSVTVRPHPRCSVPTR